jgi:hypothetical protein
MFKGVVHEIFALLVNCFREDWMATHIIIGIFEASEILRQTLAWFDQKQSLHMFKMKVQI